MNKILIIEDDLDCSKGMQICLEDKGYEVVSAKDGVEGLSKVKREDPDLIILDLMLPDIDGFEIARIIKGDYEVMTGRDIERRLRGNNRKIFIDHFVYEKMVIAFMEEIRRLRRMEK